MKASLLEKSEDGVGRLTRGRAAVGEGPIDGHKPAAPAENRRESGQREFNWMSHDKRGLAPRGKRCVGPFKRVEREKRVTEGKGGYSFCSAKGKDFSRSSVNSVGDGIDLRGENRKVRWSRRVTHRAGKARSPS